MSTQEIKTALQRLLDPTDRVLEIDGSDGFEVYSYLNNVRAITCADGLTMSVQASASHYCTPRDSVGPWIAVEVGFPSERVEALMPYIDGVEGTDPTDTVYGYVPIDVVAQAIADHGGFKNAEDVA